MCCLPTTPSIYKDPVNTAVSMALNRDDKCSGVVFANNTLY